MLRFVLPAFAITAALIVLFAGALGDLHSWPNLSDKARTIIGDVAPSPAPLPARTAARRRHRGTCRCRRGTAGGA